MQWSIHVASAWQKVKAPFVHVGGAWRPIKQGWVKVGGVWEMFFNAADYLTLVAGIANNDVGYAQGGYGSLTPSVLGDGKTIVQWGVANLNANPGPPRQMFLVISGFSADPGAGYLQSFSVNGVVTLASSATAYSYGGGTLQYTFENMAYLTNGSTYSLVVIRS